MICTEDWRLGGGGLVSVRLKNNNEYEAVILNGLVALYRASWSICLEISTMYEENHASFTLKSEGTILFASMMLCDQFSADMNKDFARQNTK